MLALLYPPERVTNDELDVLPNRLLNSACWCNPWFRISEVTANPKLTQSVCHAEHELIKMKILKLVPAFLLLLGVATSPLYAQDNSNKSLGEKTSESLEKAKDNTVDATHKVANTTRHETHKVANTTRHATHKVANTTRHTTHKVANITRHTTHKVANTTRHVTHKKSNASSNAAQKSDNVATPQ